MVEQSSEPATPRPKRVRSPSSLLRKAAKARATYAAKTKDERSAPYQKRVASASATTRPKVDKRRTRAKRGDDGNIIWSSRPIRD